MNKSKNKNDDDSFLLSPFNLVITSLIMLTLLTFLSSSYNAVADISNYYKVLVFPTPPSPNQLQTNNTSAQQEEKSGGNISFFRDFGK